MIPASAGTPEYCRITAAIRSVDASAPPIKLEVNLPTHWNHEALHMAGGGMDGSVVTGLDNLSGAGFMLPTPLQRGYATFGSDSGHEGGGADSSFAVNAEAWQNFAGDQLKKTLDVARYLIRAAYGEEPRRQYIYGGSNGGREAFLAVQRWPASYDGMIAFYPAIDMVGNILAEFMDVKAIYTTPGAWLNPLKIETVNHAAKLVCDGLDGVVDGFISNPAGCAAKFDVSVLRCPGGTDTGNNCLSDAQLQVLKIIESRHQFAFPMKDGVSSYPGLPAWNIGRWSMISYTTNGTYDPTGDGFLRSVIMKNSSVSVLTDDPKVSAARWTATSNQMDALTTDLTAFRKHGGKILWFHGYDDALIPFQGSVDYHDRLVAAYGAANLRSFVRFYGIPGYDHGFGTFNSSIDSLGALDTWVNQGAAPKAMVVSDGMGEFTRERSRPVCEWPTWPKYLGKGDVDSAASYRCAAH